jgi:hypothetical protein
LIDYRAETNKPSKSALKKAAKDAEKAVKKQAYQVIISFYFSNSIMEFPLNYIGCQTRVTTTK